MFVNQMTNSVYFFRAPCNQVDFPLYNKPIDMRRIYCLIVLILSMMTVSAQTALKTNLLYDATATINMGAEKVIAPRWSLDLSGNMNFWSFSGQKQWKHWMIQPEARYWFCDALGGHFFAMHALGGQYNVSRLDLDFNFLGTDFRKLRDSRYQGWFAGAGVGYGYAWRLGRHWNLEAEIGLGWVYTRFDRYPCAKCGNRLEKDRPHNYVGLTKMALNIVYVL